ncbi:hypothetical protein B0H15DRAFT_844244 [Mycena belliarum]|uniref:Uncharacterized protein n=1 Tax=Mycena belliarum TaxID=1033014 RepID=A0AAD6XQ40_9AGAR|nr:hypothetical protein B0H15DRAFT_844244 [Mycena belliae]
MTPGFCRYSKTSPYVVILALIPCSRLIESALSVKTGFPQLLSVISRDILCSSPLTQHPCSLYFRWFPDGDS